MGTPPPEGRLLVSLNGDMVPVELGIFAVLVDRLDQVVARLDTLIERMSWEPPT